MGGEGVAGCAGLATIITYQRCMQCARRAAGAGTEIGGTAAAAQSYIARFQSQRRAGPLSECRRPLAIRRRIAASRAARMTTRCQMLAHGNEVIERGTSVVGNETDMSKYLGDVRCWVNSGKHLLALSFSGSLSGHR